MGTIKLITLEGEMKKNPELKESDLKMLREWCEKQPHLPKVSDTDLALFLHSNYYSIEQSKINIDNYFTMRTHIPEFFKARDIKKTPELQKSLDVAFSTPLKKTTKEGYNVLFWKLLDTDASRFVHSDVMKAHSMIFDLWLQTHGTMLGHVIVVDVKGVGMGHVARTSPMIFKKFLCYLQDALPVRLKAVHFINSTPAMDMIITIMKPFMKKELLEMLHVHTNFDTFEKLVSLEILPDEAGGKAGPLAEFQKTSVKGLEELHDWFTQDELNGRVDETLRPGKAKSATELFGAEGSFKKLDID